MALNRLADIVPPALAALMLLIGCSPRQTSASPTLLADAVRTYEGEVTLGAEAGFSPDRRDGRDSPPPKQCCFFHAVGFAAVRFGAEIDRAEREGIGRYDMHLRIRFKGRMIHPNPAPIGLDSTIEAVSIDWVTACPIEPKQVHGCSNNPSFDKSAIDMPDERPAREVSLRRVSIEGSGRRGAVLMFPELLNIAEGRNVF